MFSDRQEAGRALAGALAGLRAGPPGLVLGLPRGGVPVAARVAEALGWPLDVLVVRKLGVPGQPELAAGALASGGVVLWNREVLGSLGLGEEELGEVLRREREELRRREAWYRAGRGPLNLEGRIALLVDDGWATGATTLAALKAARALGPSRLLAAAPVGSTQAVALLAGEADEVLCLETPAPFGSVGACYRDFSQTTDEEVLAWLERSARVRDLPVEGPRGSR